MKKIAFRRIRLPPRASNAYRVEMYHRDMIDHLGNHAPEADGMVSRQPAACNTFAKDKTGCQAHIF
jgi:hypothetical protein